MTSLVHIGDFHAAAGPRNADRYKALDQVITECAYMKTLGAWLWPGDLDHARMGISDKNELAGRIKAMAEHAPVFICYGNHDLVGDLDFLALLRAQYPIHVISTPQIVRQRLATGEWASLFIFPYPSKSGLVAQGVSPDAVISEASRAIDAIFRQAGADLAKARVEHDITLAIGHVNVAGAVTSTGQPNIGREIEIDGSQIAKLGDIYVGLNHIHVAQSIGGAHYAGSICRLSWGEIEPKSYIVVNYHKDTWAAVRMPIDVPPLYHVEAELNRDGFWWHPTKGPDGDVVEKPTSWRGAHVRVRYRFKQSEKTLLSDAKLLAEFAEAARLEVEPIAVPDRALRSPAVAAARNLAEKITAWCETDGAAATEGVLRKLGALEHGDHLQLLADVQCRIDAIEGKAREEVFA